MTEDDDVRVELASLGPLGEAAKFSLSPLNRGRL